MTASLLADKTDAPRPAAPSALDRYEPGLDGIRAMAIVVVLAYHGQLPWVRGAFLGISQFFTLSGFLITSILLRGRAASGTIDLVGFWRRRYRRLLPAAYLTLAGVVVFGATVATKQQRHDLPGGVVASLLQTANWFFVVTHQSYVALFAAPSPVQHFWSLAIEEQFYVALPIVLIVVGRYVRSARGIAAVLGAGAIASITLMATLYERGASLDRLYYGTDTRVAELLVGCTLAAVLHHRPLRAPTATTRRVWGALAVVAFAAELWAWTHVDLTDPWLWRGGFAAFALLTVVLIVAVLHRAGPVAGLLSARPMAAIGRVSYGLYLFHWPVFLWVDADRTGLPRWPLFAVRMALTVAITVLSYRFLERPFRARAAGPRAPLVKWIALAAVVAIVAGAFAVGARNVPSNLAGLDEPVGRAPVARVDRVLDVLVVTDAAGHHFAEELRHYAAGRRDLRVTVATDLACAGTTAIAAGTTCTNWITEWHALVARADPDVVLFHGSDWDPRDVARLAHTTDIDAQTRWIREVVGTGFHVLGARGAPIVWSTERLDAQQVLTQRNAFLDAMDRLTIDAPNVRRAPDTAIDVASTLPVLRTERRRDSTGVPRVLVVGDSSSRTLGYGMEQWAADTRRAVVWSAGTGGCGIADDGFVVESRRVVPVEGRCRAVQQGWKARVHEFDPDIVVVLSTIFDTQQRRLPGWPTMRIPGDLRFDDYLAQEYATAFDILSARGAHVVWLKSPCARPSFGPWPTDSRGGPLSTARIRHVDDVVLPRLAELRPGVRFFDLFGVLCPHGRFENTIGGIHDFRPDGIHFSPRASVWLAEHYAQQILDIGGHRSK